MKAISLWQPWASAIPLGLKRVETRGWSLKHRGIIAIHASKRFDKEQRKFADQQGLINLPFGQVIATAFLYDVYNLDLLGQFVTPLERAWGDYSPGRYGWLLIDVEPLRQPFDYRGGQGLFNVPDELIEAAR